MVEHVNVVIEPVDDNFLFIEIEDDEGNGLKFPSEEQEDGTFRVKIPVSYEISQVGKLAKFIMTEVPGGPGHSEGAVDTAIRIIRQSLESNRGERRH